MKEVRPKIVKVLAESGPVEALTLEDGVGNTPLEVVKRQAFLAKLDVACSSFKVPPNLSINYNTNPFNIAKQEAELAKFKSTIDVLLHEGRLTNGTKLTKELLAFAEHLELKIAKEKAIEDAKKSQEKDKTEKDSDDFKAEIDTGTASEVLKVLSDAITARPSLRHLVHLSDVHESVTKSLEQFKQNQNIRALQNVRVHDDEGLSEEKPDEESLLTQGWDSIASQVAWYNRILA